MSVVLIGLFAILLGFTILAIIICCFFWFLCCKAVINVWNVYRRREGRSSVPTSRTPPTDYNLREFLPQRNRGNISGENSIRRSPRITPPPDYSTIEFFPQMQLPEINNLPTYEEAVASDK